MTGTAALLVKLHAARDTRDAAVLLGEEYDSRLTFALAADDVSHGAAFIHNTEDQECRHSC
jgi:hypothetical protein